jgi:hypothetical protein
MVSSILGLIGNNGADSPMIECLFLLPYHLLSSQDLHWNFSLGWPNEKILDYRHPERFLG